MIQNEAHAEAVIKARHSAADKIAEAVRILRNSRDPYRRMIGEQAQVTK